MKIKKLKKHRIFRQIKHITHPTLCKKKNSLYTVPQRQGFKKEGMRVRARGKKEERSRENEDEK